MMLRIGTRGSKLALWQANFVKSQIQKKFPKLNIEIVVIKTTGDINLSDPLSEIGGKGVFVKEIEDTLLKNNIDIAVHSLKDVPSVLPEGLIITCYLKRHDPRDCLISKNGLSLTELPKDSVIGTGSLRRKHQFLAKFTDFTVKSIRGNIDTRINKLNTDEYDAIILAAAGLERLGLSHKVTEFFDSEFMIPSPCQGIIGIECRESDSDTVSILEEINDLNTENAANLERSFLRTFEGDCTLPIGCYAEINNDIISAKSVYVDVSEGRNVKKSTQGNVSDSVLLGQNLAESILSEINN